LIASVLKKEVANATKWLKTNMTGCCQI